MTILARSRLLPALVMAATLGLADQAPTQTGRATSSGVPDDPATARSEYLKGIRLASEGQHLASLRALDRARDYAAGVLWEFHFNVSAGLFNSANEHRNAAGHPVFVMRSSVERVASVRGALEESERAESLAVTPQDRSRILLARSMMLRRWGFAWESLELLRRALAVDPHSAQAAADLREYTRDMSRREPVHGDVQGAAPPR